MRKTIPVQDPDHMEVTVSTGGVDGNEVDLWIGLPDETGWPPFERWVTLSPGEAVLLAEALLKGARKAAG